MWISFLKFTLLGGDFRYVPKRYIDEFNRRVYLRKGIIW